MKVLMINKFFYKRGGSEAYMFDLIELLKKEGHQVIEFSMQDEKNQPSKYSEYFIKNIDFSLREGFLKDFKKACHLLYSLEAKKKLEALIKKEKPDIAHLHNFSFHLTPSIIATLKKYKLPIVWTMHDYKLICPNYRLFTQGQICERCKVYKYYNSFKYHCLRNNASFSFLAMLEMYLHKIILKSYEKIDLFVAPSKFLAEKVKGWGIKYGKVKQLYNFIDLQKFQPSTELGDGLIYFGRLTEEKGLLFVLEAVKDLKNINLKIVGIGPQKTELENFIAANKLSNVELLGHKGGQELYDLIKKSRLVIMPSIWYENNPIAVLEAFALAKPVIGTDLGGLPELITEGQTGFLFRAGDLKGIQNIIKANYNNQDLLSGMGKKAREFTEKNCSNHVHLNEIMKIYKDLSGQNLP